jgi:hypothetical protein
MGNTSTGRSFPQCHRVLKIIMNRASEEFAAGLSMAQPGHEELPAFFAGKGVMPDGFDSLMGELEVRICHHQRE